MTEPGGISPRQRLQALLSIPDRQRTEAEWEELNELEIKLAAGNRQQSITQPPSRSGSVSGKPDPGASARPGKPFNKFHKRPRLTGLHRLRKSALGERPGIALGGDRSCGNVLQLPYPDVVRDVREIRIVFAKVAELCQSKSIEEVQLFRALKAALDPQGRLNPGKVLAAT